MKYYDLINNTTTTLDYTIGVSAATKIAPDGKLYRIGYVGPAGSSIAQLFLKKSSNLYKKGIKQYINIYVITGYVLFFLSIIITLVILKKGISLKYIPVLESLGYLFVPIFSFFLYKEKLNDKLFGIILIIIGILVFNLRT